ncbi:coiled-coil domain-containing protein 167-like [Cephus cinctus]|uniref:Coiled-coil domain-containing protein 167 n=1 Tax=Cephus cinctus TaxID=211228 RepID=A0AAJ7FDA3_CEPCN|nr:coiled-coil domain-containing protein 167-like [Cephus cinctus]
MEKTKTIMTEMQSVEDTLKASLHRVDGIEKKLKTKLLTFENRERLERELEEVKEVLKRNEEQLKSLRHENTRTFMVAAALVFACFLLFGLYSMFFGTI